MNREGDGHESDALDQKTMAEAVLKVIGYAGERKFSTVGEIYKSRRELTIIQLIRLDNIDWLSCKYGIITRKGS